MIRHLYIISILISFSAQAQVPNYFSDNPEWQQSKICYDGQGNSQEWDWVYYLNGDTLINGTLWHKVFKRGTTTIYNGGVGGYSYNGQIGLIRQDSMKVYSMEQNGEELLYDFDIAIGQSTPQTYYHSSATTVVDSIEMIQINGTMRRKMYISDSVNALVGTYILEGMGSDIGLFEPFTIELNCGHYFQCYQLNGVVEVGSNCNFDLDVNELIEKEQIQLSPNPVQSSLELTTPDSHPVKSVFLVHSNGQKGKLPGIKVSATSSIFNIANQSAGIYFIEIHLENGQILREKLVKM
ncbi:MAG: T9SS type A sorting domain-containing protein [bacterium]|nr:T9SS type A sorting domain-containing protein [bacterium]